MMNMMILVWNSMMMWLMMLEMGVFSTFDIFVGIVGVAIRRRVNASFLIDPTAKISDKVNRQRSIQSTRDPT
jgi:hypothetical protein